MNGPSTWMVVTRYTPKAGKGKSQRERRWAQFGRRVLLEDASLSRVACGIVHWAINSVCLNKSDYYLICGISVSLITFVYY